jgi:Secretion system C-terminal sorting domain/FG-GAP-like repeat
MRKLLIIIGLALVASSVVAQDSMFQRIQYPVTQFGQSLAYPFSGGMNSAQWSPADLNNDGVQDIVVFDRVGHVFMTYINNWTGGIQAYHFAPEYARTFPKLLDYALLRDYDQDGAADIFCASPVDNGSQEIHVFKGYFDSNNVLRFEQQFFHYPNRPDLRAFICYPDQVPGQWNNFAVATTDIPGIDDIDGDGDLDIVAFTAGTSSYLTYLQNQSVERGYGLDSLHFILADNCWGKFFENGLSRCEAKLSTDPNQCAPPGLTNEGVVDDRDGVHPGASTTPIDTDGDGDKDVLIGNISYDCLLYMRNSGTTQNAIMDYQENDFPEYNDPVNLRTFPAAYHFDVDLDGRKDLIVSPNFPTLNEDRLGAWWYQNIADDDSVELELVTRRLFVGGMIDMGTATHPAFADVTGDGLTDMVVGNYGYFADGSSQNGRLYLYTNVGTPFAPQFTLTDDDWLMMSQFTPNDWDFAPSFGDLDADGDLDLLVGSNLGALYCFMNSAGVGNPMSLTQDFSPMWIQMDVGLSSMPHIIKYDNDNRADILVGERSGNINLFINTGSPNEPMYTTQADAAPNVQVLGQVYSTNPPSTIGFSSPTVINTPNGRVLVTGSQDGQIESYVLGPANSNPFVQLSGRLGNVREGFRTCPAFADLDADGVLEMVVGNQRGGLSLFKTRMQAYTPPTSTDVVVQNAPRLHLQPNPATDQVRIEVSGDGTVLTQWIIFDALGRSIAQGTTQKRVFDVEISDWASGTYFVQIRQEGRQAVERLVVR